MTHEAPNPKLQAPEKPQAPNTRKNPAGTPQDCSLGFGRFLGFGVWDLEFLWSLVVGAWCLLTAACPSQLYAEPLPALITISPQPLHAGHISPMLFGNFIELLDDLVPGLWAEMLNDRSLEGVTKPANWVYYDGAPDFCDREWDQYESWSRETERPFNGLRIAKLT